MSGMTGFCSMGGAWTRAVNLQKDLTEVVKIFATSKASPTKVDGNVRSISLLFGTRV